ncbi:Methyltransferase domain-containing protein [Blastococcus aurantiacus]|uniref:Methyltransferase domain-containing protein n=1 Tax=Blastococcus aurantiacus TaxID=1550231 RepID=A0A1G7MHV2_9ACTN|nr:class I SAM-dependent methyltransferase [Blastococcus aurantiacus]SDF61283.1 Methyltransferase domain-containing protein [Blastococcus aurantiacus]
MAGPDDGGARSPGRSFGSVAAGYAAQRPSYPSDAVAHLLGRGGGPRQVLDVGAGTGLLTEVVLAAGHEVVAVDPSPEMLAQLTARRPGVPALAGTAESVPLADAAVDAVVAGQAAHWFDVLPAAREFRRVLRPGGVLGLVWNGRDESVPWVAALGEVLAGEERGHPADAAVVDAFAAALRADVAVVESGIAQRVSPEDVVGGVATRSYVAVMDEVTRGAFLDGVRALLADHPDTRGRDVLDLPYRTTAYRLTPG